jgi:hypothetical protein
MLWHVRSKPEETADKHVSTAKNTRTQLPIQTPSVVTKSWQYCTCLSDIISFSMNINIQCAKIFSGDQPCQSWTHLFAVKASNITLNFKCALWRSIYEKDQTQMSNTYCVQTRRSCTVMRPAQACKYLWVICQYKMETIRKYSREVRGSSAWTV